MKYRLLVFFTAFLFTINGFAQTGSPATGNTQTPFVLGTVEKIQSVVLGETRTLNIYLPDGYSANSNTTYPVIYLLDGSANEDFIHIVGVVQFLTMIETMPKSIIVGIANIDRRRDFTFPTSIEKDKKDFPTTGGSAKFIDFVETELQPFIQKQYKTNDTTTIIGQSLGGLLAAELLLRKPWLFTNYLIVSPSFWWNNESLLNEAPGLLEQQPIGNHHVYIAVGNEGQIMENDAKRFAALLQTAGKKNLQIDWVVLPNENHLTILHNSVYKGLELLYPKKSVPAK